MKPRRLVLSRRFLRLHALQTSVICTLATTIVVNAGDILRGGGGGAVTPGTSSGLNTPPPVTPNAGHANDSLARTTQAIQAVQAMQTAARNLATSGANNLGQNPNQPSQVLPDVPDGLTTGGLKVDSRVPTTPSLWVGADGPTQTTNSGSGRVEVTIKQTAQQAILNWDTFNVGKNTDLKFDQSAGGSNVGQWTAFNKVNDTSANPTQILGTISAPGQVYIINRNGILFGGSSKVNTHTLVASALPINDNLIERGLLNNPDQQFLFSAMALTAGANGTPAFDPGVSPTTKIGDVTVQAGAQLTAPTTAEKVGGRIALIGPNVTNSGTISTPDGQTILASGLQVGMVAHSSSDPSLRGLDVYIGAVADPLSSVPAYAGTTTNSGLIDSARANILLAGKDIRQLGVVSSSTSVSLNGRIDFLANYNAVGNIAFDASNSSFGPTFLNQSTGSILLGENSVTRVVPELSSTEKTVGTKLALSSQINLTGANAHLDDGAIILSQSGDVSISVGTWLTTPAVSSSSPPLYSFLRSTGRIDLDAGSLIDVGGSQNVASSVASNIVEVQLRGAELANSPLIRDGALRGATIFVDITETGTYNGKTWIGTPLADVSGYANLVQRTVGELTASGGTVKLNAGEAVVVREGATINVSGGSIHFEGGAVKTTRVTSGGQIIDISKATPDRVYDGVYGASNTVTSDKWGTSTTYVNPIALNGSRFQEGFIQGANGGSLSITSGAMALDGSLKGGTISGPRQRFTTPTVSSLSLNFSSERLVGGLPASYFPNSPRISFSNSSSLTPIGDYGSGSNTLAADRLANVNLSPTLFGTAGFGSLSIANPDGDVVVDSGVVVDLGSRGSLDVSAANVTVDGSIIASGGAITFKAYNLSPTYVAELNLAGATDIPAPAANRGVFSLGSGGLIDVSGKVVDDRPLSTQPVSGTVQTAGGSVSISSYSANLSTGSLIHVSGGAYLSGTGQVTYGNAGSLSILAGRDLNLNAVTGGLLKLNGGLRGYSGATGGSLTLQTGTIKVGGPAPSNPNTLWLQPGFFDQGGFSKFSLIGFGELESGTGNTIPGITIAPGTTISPTVSSYLATGTTTGGPITLSPIVKPLGLRSPTSLSFSSPGVLNDFTRLLIVRGEVFTGANSTIDAGPKGSITLSGNTVEVHGHLQSSGGAIRVSGSSRYPTLLADPTAASTTVLIGSDAVIDASGSVFSVPDPYGRHRGAVLDGGTVRISGNVVAESGSILNVSGASGTLDLLAGESGKSLETLQDKTSGTLTTPYAISGTPTLVQSNGGTITLVGGEMLWSDATLKANSGGSTATGGTLQVSSGAFFPLGVATTPLDATLVVKASGPVLPSGYVAAIGADMPVDSSGIAGGGRLAVDRFTAGGFSNLDLSGTVRFSGPVSIEASGRITAGTSPVLLADSSVSLKASYVSIGTAFQAPRTADEEANFNLVTLNGAQFFMPPTHGSSTLNVSAQLIDVGYLSLRGFSSASLTAAGGDIRGSGALEVAGDITLRAGQVYSPTASSFTVAAFDYLDGATTRKGSVSIEASGTRSLPFSAGSALHIYGSIIHQSGVLRAPFGSIQLGWDGTGTAPRDKQLSNLDFAKTTELVLGSQSVTSVSAIDPITGKGITIPYGLSTNGTTWIDPHGTDITSGGIPQKTIKLSAESVITESGSQVDIRGGGDLLAYRWVNGLGGTEDLLASNGSFAVIPGYGSGFAPYAAYNASLGSTAGYVNSSLQVGEQVRLDGGGGLPAGVYTLLPARYALLPGAFLVTPQTGTAVGNVAKPDGSSVVSGYPFNGLDSNLDVPTLATRFEVATSKTVAARAEYTKLLANTFLTRTGGYRLPGDSGQLVLAATQSMAIRGNVLSAASTGFRGGLIDISSPVDILISSNASSVPTGTLVLDPTLLSGFGAESLLIGGIRSADAAGTLVTASTGNLTLDNAGSPLTGPEVILVAKNNLVLAAGSELKQTGTLGSAADILVVGNTGASGSGNATLVRVSSDPAASLIRREVTPGGASSLSVGANAIIAAKSVILDSTSVNSVDSSATITADALSLGSGRISLALDPLVTPGPDAGLVLSSSTLASLAASQSLSLASYSSIDILGAGTIGGVDALGKPLIKSLTLHTGEIRGIGLAGGQAELNAKLITLDNNSSVAPASSALTNSGIISFKAETLQLGAGTVAFRGVASTQISASSRTKATATGGLTSYGALTLNTPVLLSSQATSYAVSAAGSLQVTGDGSSTGSISDAGLGGSISLSGASVDFSSRIVMPSGQVTLRATTGNLAVSGSIEAGGYSRGFKDQTRYTDGGLIKLQSDLGSVTLAAAGSLNVAAKPGGGNAGSVELSAINGTVSLLGTLSAAGGAGGHGGSFSLDAGTLASLSALDSVLNAASFDQSRSFRVRNGSVAVDGDSRSRSYFVSADGGSINVTGQIHASGNQGGTVRLVANESVNLEAGSLIDVSAADFDSAGKGGSVSLETRGANGGKVSIKTNSTIDLAVDSWNAASADLGKFQGTLHLRAPRNSNNNDLAVDPINGSIVGASSIFVEGFKTFDLADFGGSITGGFQSVVLGSGQQFLGAAGTTISNYTSIFNRLTANNASIASKLILSPGVEVINTAVATPVALNLNTVNSTLVVASTGGSVAFPNGTPGTTRIKTSTTATLTSSTGVVTSVASNTNIAVPAGSILTLANGGTITYASGTGAIGVALNPGTSFTTSTTGTTGTVNAKGSVVTLNSITTSSIALASGTVVTLPNGTPGNNTIRATSAGSITAPNGTVTNFNSGTSVTVAAGSYLKLNNAGTVTFFSGTGGAFQVALASGSFTTSGPVTVSPPTPDITLGTPTSTAAADWNLATARFGPNSTAGFLTIRSSANILLNNSISDGFTNGNYTSGLLDRNSLLPSNAQSWSIRLVSGADFSAADTRKVLNTSALGSSSGSVQLGRNGFFALVTGGAGALTSTPLSPTSTSQLFQVIRTGSGDIDVVAARDLQLLNNFASIYTAGTLAADQTLGGTFDTPRPNMNGSNVGSLGAIQQSVPAPVQYSLAGGNVSLSAGNDIIHQTRTAVGALVADSSRQMPTNWLYRRGYVDSATGQFGISKYGELASTTWWVDFTNFFEGIGTLGGGNVTLNAGRDVNNVDAVAATNARMPSGNPSANGLIELGGGDVSVLAGRNIDAGTYYVERGKGILHAGASIVTNSTRSPSLGNLKTPAAILDSSTWLATTLFAGKAKFDVSAANDVLLGPVANPFLLPQGYNNTYWYKTWFSTYSAETSVNVASLGGSVTLRNGGSVSTGSVASLTPALQNWYETQLRLTTNPASSSSLQPWLRLSESLVTPFSSGFSLMPGNVSVTSFTGGIALVGDVTLSPVSSGSLDLLSAGSISGLQISGQSTSGGLTRSVWGSSRINLSDADPLAIPGIASPRAYQAIVGSSANANRQTDVATFTFLSSLFNETGSTDGTTQSKQNLHANGLLHADDPNPLRLYSDLDITDVELFSAKPARILASRDIRDISFYLQNLSTDSVSLVSAGRDLIAYDTTTDALIKASSSNSLLATRSGVRAGDIQISGPGTLEVFAGRNLDLGIGGNNADGTGTGITSIGNGRNPYLPFGGADIIAGAGIGAATSLAESAADFSAFIPKFVKAGDGTEHLRELGLTQQQFDSLNPEKQHQVALQVFYLILRDTGRNHSKPESDGFGNYDKGKEAIATLFPGDAWSGNIDTRARDIRTKNGGDINLFAPGGSLTLASTTIGNPLTPPGIVTEAGGNINVFADLNVNLGISRIFTLKGGDEIIWSSKGNIAAGSSSKTVQSAPPTRVLIDPTSADVKTDLAGLATGGGIGVLASVAGVEPSDVDLIAPVGTIDAGDAGIRVSGNLNISAAIVVNAANISVGGASTGTTTTSVSAPSLGGLATTTSTPSSAVPDPGDTAKRNAEGAAKTEEMPSMITVEVLGYGGDTEDAEEKKKKQP